MSRGYSLLTTGGTPVEVVRKYIENQGGEIMLKAYKYRIYPTIEQQEHLAKTFGCSRFIYNKMLSDKIEHYKETGEMLKNTPARYKKEYEWFS